MIIIFNQFSFYTFPSADALIQFMDSLFYVTLYLFLKDVSILTLLEFTGLSVPSIRFHVLNPWYNRLDIDFVIDGFTIGFKVML